MKASISPTVIAAILLAACGPAANGNASPPETETVTEIPSLEENTQILEEMADSLDAGERPLGMTDENIARMERALPSINPLENDLRDLEAVVQMTDAFRVKPDGVRLSFAATMSDGTTPFDEVFIMQPMNMVESPAVAEHAKDGHHRSMYRLAEADKLRMAAAQAALDELKADSDGNNQLNFGIEAIACREPAASETARYNLDVFFRTHPDTDFMPMYMDMMMSKDDPFAIPQFWEPCADE